MTFMGITVEITPVIVIFRRWKKCQSVIALFPFEDAGGGLVMSYEHVGQHGGADYNGVIAQTTPVKADEPDVKDLFIELTSIGYFVVTRQRKPKRI